MVPVPKDKPFPVSLPMVMAAIAVVASLLFPMLTSVGLLVH